MIDEFAKEYLHEDLRSMVHVLTETSRPAGHADILREQLDGTVGTDAQSAAFQQDDAARRDSRRARIEQAARAADPACWPPRIGEPACTPHTARHLDRGCGGP